MNTLMPALSSAPNLHPMLVHFPIVLWLLGTGLWFVAMFRHDKAIWHFGLWIHSLGFVSALLAVTFGYWATNSMGHDAPGHDLVHAHRDIMLIATTVSGLLTTLAWWKRRPNDLSRLLLMALAMTLLTVMTLGADRGAELVFS